MRCDDVSLLLSEAAEASYELPRSISRHAEHCLRCQAEQAQYRKIRRTMISMRSAFVDPGAAMVAEVMALVRDDIDVVVGRHHGDRRRAAYVAAATAAATAATAAGAIVLARSKRPAS